MLGSVEPARSDANSPERTMSHDQYFADNQANWNDRVPIHAGPDGYNLQRYLEDPTRISEMVALDKRYLGDVSGRTLLHMQCHIGTDTLSWARLGADVTGIDFSAPALEVARSLATDLGLDARFVQSDVYDAPDVLNEQFDIVYTGVGAINWLPDIARWAQVVASFTKPGGTFYMLEGHPVLWSLDHERTDGELVISEPYFETTQPMTWEEDSTYLGTGTVEHATTHEWNHGLGEIVSALIGAGFRIELLDEHKTLYWLALQHMIEEAEGHWVLPEQQRNLVPLMYSLKATRT